MAHPFSSAAEFERHEAGITPSVVEFFETFGPRRLEALQAYGSVVLYHNTLSNLVPSILEDGLVAGNALAVPDEEDVAFAETVFLAKGRDRMDPSAQRRFNLYIKGVRGEREPGVFFYARTAGKADHYHSSYGIPERLDIFTAEMGYLAGHQAPHYTDTERGKARELYKKYAPLVFDHAGGQHIAVIRANPFSPNVINSRLGTASAIEPETAIETLKILDTPNWEGTYVTSPVPGKDLELVEGVELPLRPQPDVEDIDPSFSRFY